MQGLKRSRIHRSESGPHRSHLASCCLIALAAMATNVAAQSAPEQSAQSSEETASGKATQLDTVQITASRVARQGFESPTPTTVLDREALDVAGNSNIAETINELPSMRPSMTHTSTTNNSDFTGGNFMDLRGLGFRRALVLVDGKRATPTHVQGAIDMNMIPQGIISKVEIVTGGASAAWGSDAVAGVANLVFDRNFVGVKGNAQMGTTTYGDRDTKLLSLTWGKEFADSRGHFIISADANRNSGVRWMRERTWGGWNKIANPAYTATNDEPRQLLVYNGRSSALAYGGLINSGPLAGTAFDSDGNPVPFTYGDLRTSSTMRGGDGSADIENLPLEAPVDRYTAYSRASFDFTDNLTGYLEASWGRSSGVSPSLTRSDSGLTIRRDNPFIPSAIAAQMDELGLASIRIGRYNRDYGTSILDRSTVMQRGVVGLEGAFGDTWSWDAYYTAGETRLDRKTRDHRITARLNPAVDAVTDPVTGEAICRSAAARAEGCHPLNLFGENQMSQESLDYVLGTAWVTTRLRQNAAAFALRGEPWTLAAGPVSVATGAEWRREEVDLDSDPLSQSQAFATGNAIPFSGAQSVKEAFGEVVVPLLSERDWARKLELNLAARVTDYSLSGTVNTWKAGMTWAANDIFLVRAAKSRDIRAPSLNDIYSRGSTSVLSVFDPELNLQYQVRNVSSGNAGLVPEEADTLTLGIVVTPNDSFGFSLDYYDVKLDKAIITLAAAETVERCYSTQPQLCRLLDRDPITGRVTSVNVSPQNLEQLHLSGVDLEATWRINLPKSRLTLRSLVSYIDTLTMDDGMTVTQMAGQTTQPTVSGIGGQPRWRGSFSANYARGPLRLNATARHVGGGVIDHTYTSKDLNILEHSGRTYIDLGGSYDFIRNRDGLRLTAFATIKNAANKSPPINGVGGYATTRALYDVIGRQYIAGIRFGF